MAKPTRPRVRKAAPARKTASARTRTHAHLPVSRRYTYTPELLAEGRRRYELTEDRVVDIAADFGIHPTTFQRMANRENWVRYKAPPRDLSRSAKALAEIEALEAANRHPEAPERSEGLEGRRPGASSHWPPSFEGGKRPPPQDDGASAAHGQGPLPEHADTIDRLHRVVLAELATVEAMRARMKAEPETPAAADVTARTLARHTQILQTLQRMRCGLPETQTHDSYDDDMPADLDAFRDALARRIRAFVESRSEPGGAVRDDESPLADAPRP